MSAYPFVETEMNFVPSGVRNPEVRYIGGAGESIRNYQAERRNVRIANGRLREDDHGLDRSGFELLRRPTMLGPVKDHADPAIEEIYYPEVEEILRDATGATDVVIFDHTIRITGSDDVRRPVMHVHNDYTDRSGPVRLGQLIGEAEAAGWLGGGRVAQVNLWRPLTGPVQTLPLGLVDSRSIGPHDLRETALIFDDRVGQIYHLSHSPAHRWTYFPDMTPDEAILIKGYDNATDGRARFAPHSAFTLPNEPKDAPPRHSIEVRTFLRFD